MGQVFLSYARRDLPNLQPLLQDLGAHGITVWRDQDNLYGGQYWPKAICLCSKVGTCKATSIRLRETSTSRLHARLQLLPRPGWKNGKRGWPSWRHCSASS